MHAPWGQLASRRKGQKGLSSYIVSPSELTIQMRSCAFSGIECVEVERTRSGAQEGKEAVLLSSTFKWKWRRSTGCAFLGQPGLSYIIYDIQPLFQ